MVNIKTTGTLIKMIDKGANKTSLLTKVQELEPNALQSVSNILNDEVLNNHRPSYIYDKSQVIDQLMSITI